MTLRRRVRAVSFDCWNTLLREGDFEAARAARTAALVEAAGRRGVELAPEQAAGAIRGAHERHLRLWRQGVGSGAEEMAAWSLETVGLADPALAGPLGRRFAEAGLAGRVETLDGAGETLERLASRGVRIALVCDTGFSPGAVVRRMLQGLGLLEPLEVQVFSNEIGVPKPHRSLFEAALRPLAVAAGEALHVGDLRPTDVAGGRGFGMGTVRIRAAFDDRSELPDADAVVDSHAALLDLLEDAH